MSWIKIATLLVILALVLCLRDVLGDTLAHGIMWGIAGLKLGDWATQLGNYLEARYGQST